MRISSQEKEIGSAKENIFHVDRIFKLDTRANNALWSAEIYQIIKTTRHNELLQRECVA
jgi:hypothetical protein